MSGGVHWTPSRLVAATHLPTGEARRYVLEGKQHRPGTTGRIPGDTTLDAYNKWAAENADRPRVMAGPIERAQEHMGPDFQPGKPLPDLGVGVGITSTGEPGVALGSEDRVDLPDKRESFGHNTKNRFIRVRGS